MNECERRTSKLIAFSCANFLVHLLAKNVFNVNIIGIDVKDFEEKSLSCVFNSWNNASINNIYRH